MGKIELSRFHTEFLQDVSDTVVSNDAGGIREEKFTELVLEFLEESGETEGSIACREIRENSIGNRIHKINGYAISEGYETIDIFITLFKGTEDIVRIYSDELKSAINLSTRFMQNVLSDKMQGIEESAPIFDFVQTINKIKTSIVRINIYILSDAMMPFETPEKTVINEIGINYHIRDIEYFYRIFVSGSGKETIEIEFEKKFFASVPCLSMPVENADYESYLLMIPAGMLADIYREYGSRLLEQNVRTFLQFRGNINKGIRDTILREPHMFMAYNNGISATAESVILSDTRNAIISVKDFQIVNGGQTTASIFQTRRKYKDADINAVCVQMKLTVIKDPQKKADIVSRISRYANTQNKVSEADLSSNNPFHIEIEELSRKMWTPATAEKKQTRWFYERARGQYNDELSKIDTVAEQKKWIVRNPKSQMFAKEDLSRFFTSWEMTPWWVVRGRQRNFIEFMKTAEDISTDQIFYEDLISKAIIFRTAEKLYGSGSKAIGDLRYMVVPYTISWLRFHTGKKINLFKIWKYQRLSDSFEKLLFDILQNVDSFMRDTAPGGLIGEWAKKEDCWRLLKALTFEIDLSRLENDYFTAEEIQGRYYMEDINNNQKLQIEQEIKKIDSENWIRVDQWGKTSGHLDILQSNFIWKIISKIEKKKSFTDKDINQASSILSILKIHFPELFEKL